MFGMVVTGIQAEALIVEIQAKEICALPVVATNVIIETIIDVEGIRPILTNSMTASGNGIS